jgi:hypothetical protein
MIWVSNEPKDPARQKSLAPTVEGNAEKMPAYLEWRSRLIEGRPKATNAFTVEQLESMGIIGLYEPEPAPSQKEQP